MSVIGAIVLGTTAVASEIVRPTLPEELYFSSSIVSGSRICDRRLSERQHRMFERTYGERIARLRSRHPEIPPEQWDVVHTTDCINIKSRRGLAKSFRDYDGVLAQIEERYR
jgi:hypothetical protein